MALKVGWECAGKAEAFGESAQGDEVDPAAGGVIADVSEFFAERLRSQRAGLGYGRVGWTTVRALVALVVDF